MHKLYKIVVFLCQIGVLYCLCPSKCTCDVENIRVNCTAAGMQTIPPGLNDNIVSLILRDNLIYQLGKYEFLN